jgi:glutamine synthetase
MTSGIDWAQPFFDLNPDVEVIEAFVIDVNGQARGKWIPLSTAKKVLKGELRLPRSSFAMDIWGKDVLDAGLVLETGDSDGVCVPAEHTLARVPWLERPTAQLMMSMCNPDGTPFYGDPRQVLAKIAGWFAEKGWTPVVACELEFYFVDPKGRNGRPLPPISPATGRRLSAPQVYSVSEMQEFEGVLAELARTCLTQGIPADTTISENGPGQYEINLNHVPDVLMAADYAVLMKRAVKGVARRHNLGATFMAKPYGEYLGNGLHIHFSILDEKGVNIFAGKDANGSPILHHAIGGLLESMADNMAIFAPNANSYRRFQAGSSAPTTTSWGYDNRSTAIRVPDSNIPATRIEQRVAGADAHPHLVMAAILSAACHGMVEQIDPGLPMEGETDTSMSPSLPTTWEAALSAFEISDFVAEQFGVDYRNLYSACKRQEKNALERIVTDVECETYMWNV